ncbi:MAG: hypothetical protein H0S79_15785 [Anaerolineaceae bacterium]|nr:hypothetical protein [Anaerolineaceae bacterium]
MAAREICEKYSNVDMGRIDIARQSPKTIEQTLEGQLTEAGGMTGMRSMLILKKFFDPQSDFQPL